MKTNRTRAVLAFGGGLLLLVIVISLISQTNSKTSASAVKAPATPAASPCGSTVTYFAYDASGEDFGLAIHPSSKAEALKAVKSTFCADPLNFAANQAFAEHGLKFNPASAEQLAGAYASNQKAWQVANNKFFATAKDWQLVNDHHKYYSIGMKTGEKRSIQPKLVRGSEPVDVGLALTYKWHGVTREVRLKCRIQPVEHKQFKTVPPPAQVAPPTSTPKPPVYHTCQQLGTCVHHGCSYYGTCVHHGCSYYGTCVHHGCSYYGTCVHHGCSYYGTCVTTCPHGQYGAPPNCTAKNGAPSAQPTQASSGHGSDPEPSDQPTTVTSDGSTVSNSCPISQRDPNTGQCQ